MDSTSNVGAIRKMIGKEFKIMDPIILDTNYDQVLDDKFTRGKRLKLSFVCVFI